MKRVTTPSKSLPASEIQQKIEIIPDKVYFLVIRLPPKSSSDEFCFSVDANQEFQYLPFFYDFGPPSLLQIHKFYHLVVSLMKSHSTKKIVYMTSSHASHLSNGVLFITSFRMLFLKLSADEAYSPCNFLSNSLKPYRDASTLPCTYDLTVLSCLKGLQKAMELGWYNLETFNQEEWEKYEQVENGDMNWLIPGKLMAFATPYNTNILNGGWRVATPKDVLPIFKKYKINHVIRLCQKFYNEEVFKQGGLKHSELYFLDGTTPPMTIREKFLKIIESDDVVALHCKAGLGRTGTLAGCYMIKNFHFTPHEAIGWIRVCRPGSIIGPQQRYLISYADQLHRLSLIDIPKRQKSKDNDSKQTSPITSSRPKTTSKFIVSSTTTPTPVRHRLSDNKRTTGKVTPIKEKPKTTTKTTIGEASKATERATQKTTEKTVERTRDKTMEKTPEKPSDNASGETIEQKNNHSKEDGKDKTGEKVYEKSSPSRKVTDSSKGSSNGGRTKDSIRERESRESQREKARLRDIYNEREAYDDYENDPKSKSLGVSAHYPQPRKFNRAMANSRVSTAKK